MTLVNKIKTIIEEAFETVEVHVFDPHQDGQHFQALVISPEFEGVSLVAQHQRVMGALADAFANDVHALSLKTFTPEKWQQKKDQYL